MKIPDQALLCILIYDLKYPNMLISYNMFLFNIKVTVKLFSVFF